MKHLAGLLQSGKLRSVVSKTFNLDEMAKAHLEIESGKTRGNYCEAIKRK